MASYLDEDPRRADALRCLVASFQAQTYSKWVMNVVHDGPRRPTAAPARLPDDGRLSLVETPERRQKFGHPWRQYAIDVLCRITDWLLLTNDDNYYAPTFLEWMLFTACSTPSPGCALVYCDMVHSHQYWKVLHTELRRGKIDLGAVLVRSDLAREVPFDDHSFAGDWAWVERLAAAARGRVQKVPAVLFCHN